jgi:hypothetical protein
MCLNGSLLKIQNSTGITNFSSENFNTLQITLKHCISYVRFYNLTSKGFLEKILPYEQVLLTDELTFPYEFKLLFRDSRDGLTRHGETSWRNL